MKQIILLQGKALLIEMPNLKLITTIHKGLLVAGVNQKDVSSKCRRIDRGDIKGFVQLPPGNWQILGMLSEVTENQLDGVIESDTFMGGGVTIHKNYNQGGWLPTRVMSLDSAISADGWYFDPIGDEPIRLPEGHNSHGTHEAMWNQWREVQSRVLCRERCLLLGREG